MQVYSHENSRGRDFFLHSMQVTLKGSGKVMTIYFFALEVREEYAVSELPEGYEIIENARTGLPLLKKIR